MGTIKSSTLLNKAQTILQDATETRWPITELLGWLNDGQREIVLLKPDANTSSGPESLGAGIKQTLPTGGILFIDIFDSDSLLCFQFLALFCSMVLWFFGFVFMFILLKLLDWVF